MPGKGIWKRTENYMGKIESLGCTPATNTSLLTKLILLSHPVVSTSTTPWIAARQASLCPTISWHFLKFMSIEFIMPSNHLILRHPLPLPSIFPSIRVFFNELAVGIRWPKYWGFSIGPSNEYSGLISFRIHWFALLAVQEPLKSLLQHHNSETSNSLVLSLLYGPALTSIHDYRENHGFDYTDLHQQSGFSAF